MAELEEELTKEIRSLIAKSSPTSPSLQEKDQPSEDVGLLAKNFTTTRGDESLPTRRVALDRLQRTIESLATEKEALSKQNQILVDELKLLNNDSTNERNENAKDLAEELQDRVKVLESEKEHCSREAEQRDNELVKAGNRLKIAESLLAQRVLELESKIVVQNATHAGVQELLEWKITEMEGENSNNEQRYTDEIRDLSDTVGDLRATNDELRLEVETGRELQKQKSDKCNRIESQMKELEKTNEVLKDELSAKVQEIEAAEQVKSGEIAQLSRSFEENSDRLKEMFAEQQQLQTMNQELKLANLQANSDTEKLLKDKDWEISNLNETLELTRGEKLELQEQFKVLEEKFLGKDRDKEEDIRNLNLLIEAKCKEYESLMQTRDELQVRNSELENLISSKEVDIEKLLLEKENELAALNTTIDENKVEMARLDSHCSTLQEHNSELENLISSKEAEIEKLQLEKENELVALNTTIDENKVEMVRLDSHCSTLQEHNSELESLISSKEAEIEKLQLEKENELVALNTTIDESKAEMVRLDSHCSTLQEQNLTLEQTIQHQMDEFQESLSCREREIDLLNKSVEETTGGLRRLKEQNLKLLTDAQALEKNLGQRSEEIEAPSKVDTNHEDVTNLANLQKSRTDINQETEQQEEIKGLIVELSN